MPGPRLGEPGFSPVPTKSKQTQKPSFFVPNVSSAFGIYNINKSDPRLVKQIQGVLKQLGLYKAGVDGVWGPQTEAAWKIYSRPGKGGFSLGAGTQYKFEQAKFLRDQQQEILKRYQQLSNTLARQVRGGDLSTSDRTLSLIQFWAGVGSTAAGGAFKKEVAEARSLMLRVEKERALQTAEQRKVLAANKPNLLERGLGAVLRPASGLARRLNVGGVPGNILTKGLKAAAFPFEVVAARPFYAYQRLQRQAIAEGRESLAGAGSFSNMAQAVVGSLGGRALIDPDVRRALEETDSYEEREALRQAGLLESFGEHMTRDMFASLITLFGSDKQKELLRTARSPEAATPGFNLRGSLASGLLDFGFNFLDPTLAVGVGLRTASAIDDAVKAGKFLARNPGLANALTKTAADAAARAAARDVGMGIGDVVLLQKLVPSLKGRGVATELAAALVSTDTAPAMAYLGRLREASNASTQVGLQFRALVDDAITLVRDKGLTQESRQAILKASLGRTWKPRITFRTRGGTRVLDALPGTMAGRGLSAMPRLTRQARLGTLTDLTARRTRARTSYIGRPLQDPMESSLLRFADRSATERESAKAFLKVLKEKDPNLQVELRGLSKRISNLPESPLKRALEEQFGATWAKVDDYVDAQLAGLSSAEKGYLAKNPAEFARMLAESKARVKALSKTGQGNKLVSAQAKLSSLKRVDEIRKGQLRQPALRKELMQLRKTTVAYAKVQPITYERAVYNFRSEMRDYAYMMGSNADPRVSPWTRAARAARRTFDDVPKAVVNLHDTNERTKAFYDYALALGASRADAAQAMSRMARTMPSEDALKEAETLATGLLRNFLRAEGLDGQAVKDVMGHIARNADEFWRDQEGWFSIVDAQSGAAARGKFDKVFDVKGARDPRVLSQFQYNFHMVDPVLLRRYVLDWKRRQGGLMSGVREGAYVASLGLYQAYRPVHHAFKFLALTLAAPRYVLRVAAMEERLRMWMTHGFTSTTEISSRHARRLNAHMLDETAGARWFTGWEHVGIENMPMHLMSKKMIQVTGHGLIDRGGKGFTENLWHVLMFQVQPERDFVHALLMPHLYGDEAALAAARESAIETLETTRNGRVYLEKATQLDPKYRDSSYLVDKVEKWLREVLPNGAVIKKRLDGQFSIDELKRHPEWFPEKIWGDKYQSLWKPQNPVNWFHDVAGRLVIQAPTTHLNRLPFAFAEYNREFDALVVSGFTAEAATEMAADHAVHRTNAILFDASVRSRFATKFDVLFPFQQAREEVVRVWARIIRENPQRAAKTLQLVTAAFNAGRNNEIITQNQYGQWQMNVPGSPALSRALGRWAPDWLPFKEGLKDLAGNKYTFELRGLMFVNDVWGMTPRPGGPWWSGVANVMVQSHPEWFPEGSFLQKYLYNEFYPSTLVFRPEVTRLYIALTGDTHVPWEPAAMWGWGGHESTTERIRDRLVGEIGAELYSQWVKAGAKPSEKPTGEDVANAVRATLFQHGMLGMFVPAATRVTVPGREDFEDIKGQYTVDGVLDVGALLRVRPDLYGFVVPRTKDIIREAYTREDGTVDIERLQRENPGYWEHWKARGSPYEDGPAAMVDAIFSARDYLSADEWVQMADQSRRTSQAWHDFHLIVNSGDSYAEKTIAMAGWQKENADQGEAFFESTRDYRRDLEFDQIMKLPPDLRDNALKEWQYKWNASVRDTEKLTSEWHAGIKDHYNPWVEARNTADLTREYINNPEGLSAQSWAEKKLKLHERLNFYNYMLNYVDDIQDFNELWGARGELIAKNYDALFGNRATKNLNDIRDQSAIYWGEKKHDAALAISKKYDDIGAITKQQQAIIDKVEGIKDYKARGALWAQYFALKDKKNRLYAEVRGIQNSLYRQFPDLKTAADEVKMLRIVGQVGYDAIKKNGLDDYGIPYLLDSQERKFQQMPPRIQQDYLDDLVERLTVEPGRFVTERGESSLKWSYLTEFQKDLLRAKLSKRQLDTVRRMSLIREREEAKGRRRGRWQIDGRGLGQGFGELAFAIEMFKRYNQRPKSLPEPKQELEEYRKLGDNTVLKSQYLRQHPKLQEWFRLGPMANMPASIAVIVQHIMQKYGKWEFTGIDPGDQSWDDVSEIGFARTMLDKYNRRGGQQAPAAYELWLAMPTGKKRFDYMKMHPEIERWLQMGPMANMPPEYREVVRDIMMKFGLWEERQDPLSKLITEYYAVPDYAKQAFLAKHPEILAYWRAIRTGHERRMFDLAQTYFAIQDPDGKRSFLAAHPELQQHFVDERKRRYEDFLFNVSRYLGQMPELAELYLQEQTIFIKELLDRFGQRPLVEPMVTKVSYAPRRQSTTTRVRQRVT